MTPVEFKEVNVRFAEEQDEYRTLPAYTDDTVTISLWRFTFWERLQILFGRKVFITQMNFGKALQPILPSLENPFVYGEQEND